jgi:hypothetical protein
MFISSKTCRLALLVLAAASCIAGTATELPEDHHPVLRGNSRRLDALEDALTPFDGDMEDIAVMSGAGMIFTHPATNIKDGDVCGDSSLTGLPSTDTTNLDYKMDTDNGGKAYLGGCSPSYLTPLISDAMAKTAKHIISEMGGKTFIPGTYFSAPLTVAANTVVTLDAEDKEDAVFLFLSGSYMVTGANTQFELINGAKAKNVLFATTGYTTVGAAGSTLGGSILAGAAITLGDGSDVSGYVLATAAMTAGAECTLNSALIGPETGTGVSPIVAAIAAAVCPVSANDDSEKSFPFACPAGCSATCSKAAGCKVIAAGGEESECDEN